MAHYFTHEENLEHMKTQPTKRTGVMTVMFNPAGEVLLVKPIYKPTWNLVGGMIDANESPLDAAVREAREETGLNLAPERFALLGVHYLEPWNGFNDFLRIFFSLQLTEKEAGQIQLPEDELEGKKFVPVKALAEEPERLPPRGAYALLTSKRGFGYAEVDKLRGADA
jgi:8-oxo-dGTP diphosphatase